jgi:putative phosphoribosyl transferase
MNAPPIFLDRVEAGRRLTDALPAFKDHAAVLVLALPRGGVPVAFQIALALNAPLDVVPVRKVTVPEEPELALGAVAGGGVRLIDTVRIRALGVSAGLIEERFLASEIELGRQEAVYHAARPPLDVRGKTVILVDDGLATGLSMKAAVAALRQRGAAQIVVAVPVAAEDACADVARVADQVVALARPKPFFAVGEWYVDFCQVTDSQVEELLKRAARREALAA